MVAVPPRQPGPHSFDVSPRIYSFVKNCFHWFFGRQDHKSLESFFRICDNIVATNTTKNICSKQNFRIRLLFITVRRRKCYSSVILQRIITADVELLYPPRTVRANCWTGPLVYGDSFVQNILLDRWKYGGGVK